VVSFHESNSQKAYSQDLSILPPFPKNYVSAVKGNLVITNDSVSFNPRKQRHANYRFSYHINEIVVAKKWGAFFIPNPWFFPIMIKVKTSSGDKITLVTMKRKKILTLLNKNELE